MTVSNSAAPQSPNPVPPPNAAPAVAPPSGPRPTDVVRGPLGWGRETVESVVVAFTLALLFRAFEAEAFVIPTGSMAPTLMGRHKDLACDACGRDYRVGCSAEEDDQSQSFRAELARLEAETLALKAAAADTGRALQEREGARRRLESLEGPRGPRAQLQSRLASKLIAAAKCPNCGRVMPLVEQTPRGAAYDPRYPSYNGDRILVNKFAYDFTDPRRWDVVVFKYPEDAKTNYIKRLVGLPGETVSIAGGDIWTSRDGLAPEIARKPPDRMQAMLQCVHTSENESEALRKAGWPICWSDWNAAGEAPGWTSPDSGRTFTATTAAGAAPATLRYRHFLPGADDWDAVEAGASLAGKAEATVIDDFQPYNAIATRSHWVGDLAIEVRLENRSEAGSVVLDLVEAGQVHTCTIDLASGEAVVTLPGEAGSVRGATRVRGRGAWTLLFANVDDELSLVVDGRRVQFDRPATWTAPIEIAEKARPISTEAVPGGSAPSDLSPAGVTVSGADVQVSNLRILRDIFYIGAHDVGMRAGELIERQRLDFPLEEDQFFVLGDNSAASKDSRLWVEGHHVDRHLLVGRALVIFWPHAVAPSWSFPLKIAGMELRLPSWPNFARMRFVR